MTIAGVSVSKVHNIILFLDLDHGTPDGIQKRKEGEVRFKKLNE